MNLVCFSNNTAGGLLCNLLNNVPLIMNGYKTTNQEHSQFKISDTPTIQRHIDPYQWQARISQVHHLDKWFGTHCHPSAIPDLRAFDRVIAITTETRSSKLYRWLRYYHGWFKQATPDWQETESLESIDKIRELAKNVFDSFESHTQCENIEFEDIVNGRFVEAAHLNQLQFDIWQHNNEYLYSSSNTWAIKRFEEAEWELANNAKYRYV
jgi:hypothetical protein